MVVDEAGDWLMNWLTNWCFFFLTGQEWAMCWITTCCHWQRPICWPVCWWYHCRSTQRWRTAGCSATCCVRYLVTWRRRCGPCPCTVSCGSRWTATWPSASRCATKRCRRRRAVSVGWCSRGRRRCWPAARRCWATRSRTLTTKRSCVTWTGRTWPPTQWRCSSWSWVLRWPPSSTPTSTSSTRCAKCAHRSWPPIRSTPRRSARTCPIRRTSCPSSWLWHFGCHGYPSSASRSTSAWPVTASTFPSSTSPSFGSVSATLSGSFSSTWPWARTSAPASASSASHFAAVLRTTLTKWSTTVNPLCLCYCLYLCLFLFLFLFLSHPPSYLLHHSSPPQHLPWSLYPKCLPCWIQFTLISFLRCFRSM